MSVAQLHLAILYSTNEKSEKGQIYFSVASADACLKKIIVSLVLSVYVYLQCLVLYMYM